MGASVVGASVVGASIDGASVVGASVVGAVIVGTSVDGASIVGASVVGASVDGASVVGASVAHAATAATCQLVSSCPCKGATELHWCNKLEPKWCIISIHILTTRIAKFYEHLVKYTATCVHSLQVYSKRFGPPNPLLDERMNT